MSKLKLISRMRLSVINEYVPIQRRPFIGFNWFTFVNLSAGARNMGDRIVYAQATLFGYGFQLWGKR